MAPDFLTMPCGIGRGMLELKTYSDQITDYIKSALLRGDLRPGDKVNEVKLANALSISRAPVREALQMLVKEGLILSIPQRGKFIRALTPKEISDSYSIGGVLEGAAVAGSIASFCAEDFAALEVLLDDMNGLDETAPDYAERFALLDIAFHDAMLAKTDNKLMVEQARTVCQRVSKFLLFRHWPGAFTHAEVVKRHRKLVSVLGTRSRPKIEAAIREHYRELGDRMAPFGRMRDVY